MFAYSGVQGIQTVGQPLDQPHRLVKGDMILIVPKIPGDSLAH
jgi:hypothetical protein